MDLVLAPGNLRTYILQSFIFFFDISKSLECFTILSSNTTTDFSLLCSFFILIFIFFLIKFIFCLDRAYFFPGVAGMLIFSDANFEHRSDFQ